MSKTGVNATRGWNNISQKPDKPLPILLYFGNLVFHDQNDNLTEFPPYREERVEVGFWDGDCWCYAGTGHDAFEFHGMAGYPDEHFPTHWMPLPTPPAAANSYNPRGRC